MPRTIVIEVETDSEDSLASIKKDIEAELNCCFNSYDVVEISEKEKGEEEMSKKRNWCLKNNR